MGLLNCHGLCYWPSSESFNFSFVRESKNYRFASFQRGFLIKKVLKLLNLISETQSHIWLHTDLLMACFILLAHHVFLHFIDGLVNAGMSTTF